MKHNLLSILLAAACGCASYGQKPIRCDPAAYAGIPASGTATITGQAFATTRGGDVKYAAGENVWLAPCTDYDHQQLVGMLNDAHMAKMAKRETGKRLAVSAPDPASAAHRQTTRADAEGRFAFAGVPAGRWLLATRVAWETGGGFGGPRPQGGAVIDTVTVVDGQAVSVILMP